MRKPCYMIGAVSQMLGLHPQTIRQYEKMGFITPERTGGNTRMYSDHDLDQLRFIMSLTRDMGINLAGVEMIVQMKDHIDRLEETLNTLNRRITERYGEMLLPPDDGNRVIIKIERE